MEDEGLEDACAQLRLLPPRLTHGLCCAYAAAHALVYALLAAEAARACAGERCTEPCDEGVLCHDAAPTEQCYLYVEGIARGSRAGFQLRDLEPGASFRDIQACVAGRYDDVRQGAACLPPCGTSEVGCPVDTPFCREGRCYTGEVGVGGVCTFLGACAAAFVAFVGAPALLGRRAGSGADRMLRYALLFLPVFVVVDNKIKELSTGWGGGFPCFHMFYEHRELFDCLSLAGVVLCFLACAPSWQCLLHSRRPVLLASLVVGELSCLLWASFLVAETTSTFRNDPVFACQAFPFWHFLVFVNNEQLLALRPGRELGAHLMPIVLLILFWKAVAIYLFKAYGKADITMVAFMLVHAVILQLEASGVNSKADPTAIWTPQGSSQPPSFLPASAKYLMRMSSCWVYQVRLQLVNHAARALCFGMTLNATLDKVEYDHGFGAVKPSQAVRCILVLAVCGCLINALSLFFRQALSSGWLVHDRHLRLSLLVDKLILSLEIYLLRFFKQRHVHSWASAMVLGTATVSVLLSAYSGLSSTKHARGSEKIADDMVSPVLFCRSFMALSVASGAFNAAIVAGDYFDSSLVITRPGAEWLFPAIIPMLVLLPGVLLHEVARYLEACEQPRSYQATGEIETVRSATACVAVGLSGGYLVIVVVSFYLDSRRHEDMNDLGSIDVPYCPSWAVRSLPVLMWVAATCMHVASREPGGRDDLASGDDSASGSGFSDSSDSSDSSESEERAWIKGKGLPR